MKPIRFTLQAVASIVLMLVVSACPPTPVNPPPDADASIIVVDAAVIYSCGSWCTQAAILGCPAASTSDRGASCLEVCANVQSGPVPFDLACRTRASSCAQADGCEGGLGASAERGIDAGLYDLKKTTTCSDWCAHASRLKCPAAQLTPKGATCMEVCQNIMTGPKPFNLKCRANALSCDNADRCEP